MSPKGAPRLAAAIVLLCRLGACGRPTPALPDDAGICWIAPTGSATFLPLDQGIENLETCGARLEVVFLLRRRPVVGAYRGYYVFVDASGIAAAAPNGPRAPLFEPATRKPLDAQIRRLMAARAEAAAG